MSINDPTWSYGESKLFKSSGSSPEDGSDDWVYGENVIYHEYVASGGGVIPVIIKHLREQGIC